MKKYILVLLCVVIVAACKENKVALNLSQEVAFHYLYNKARYTDTFSRILFDAPIDFRAIHAETNMLYFVFDKSLPKQEYVNKVAIDPTKVIYAPCKSGFCDFDGLRGDVDDIVAFKMPLENLKVDKHKVFNCRLSSFKDSFNIPEIKSLLDSNKYYQAKPFFEFYGKCAANLGVLILKKNQDKKFTSIAQRIVGKEKDKKKIAQLMLDFVINEIDYSYADFWYWTEVLKRPHEVLLSGFGDCSAKTILYASLLEQYDIPYVLIYYKNHVNVGVGLEIPAVNNYEVEIGNKRYSIAETTCKNYKIGQTVLKDFLLSDAEMYQNPRKSISIYKMHSNEKKTLLSEQEAIDFFY